MSALHSWWRNEPHDHVMSLEEAAGLVGIDAGTIAAAIKRGEGDMLGFPVFKAGRRYVVPRRPLHALLGIETK